MAIRTIGGTVIELKRKVEPWLFDGKQYEKVEYEVIDGKSSRCGELLTCLVKSLKEDEPGEIRSAMERL